MSNYYQTNAIYTFLETKKHSFIWVSGNAWILVYGNKLDRSPKIIVLAHGISWKPSDNILKTLKYIEKKSKIPICKVLFDDALNVNINKIKFAITMDSPYQEIDLNHLKNIFIQYGLDVDDGICDKYLNDAVSSAYHNWQRKTLGNRIIVSDIDMIRLNMNEEPIEILELKRSSANVNTWKPYQDDFINFDLLNSIATLCDLPLTIVYNQYFPININELKNGNTTHDYYPNKNFQILCISSKNGLFFNVADNKRKNEMYIDIPSPVSLYGYQKNNAFSIIKEIPIDDLISGEYLNESKKVDNIPICISCGLQFTPKYQGAPMCLSCWNKKKNN